MMLVACLSNARIQTIEQPRPASTTKLSSPLNIRWTRPRVAIVNGLVFWPVHLHEPSYDVHWRPGDFWPDPENSMPFSVTWRSSKVYKTYGVRVHVMCIRIYIFHPTACRLSVKAARPNVSILHIPTEYRDGVPGACFCHWIYNAERTCTDYRAESNDP